MTSTKISCWLDSTNYDADLNMKVCVDDQKVFDNVINKPTELVFEINDDPGSHCLRFEMQNKTFDHTQISESGEIVSDARLIVKDIQFEGIELGYLFTEMAVYTHNFNGTGETVNQSFYGEMGCNGTVALQFETPIYQWLLKNM